jgi:hypothetical protein
VPDKKTRSQLEALKQRLIDEARAEEDAVDVDGQVDEIGSRYADGVTVYGKAHADFSVIAEDEQENN